ncbi:MAG: hypothetical protein CO129_06930 [Ignavibacteriales bacterium CG_4_9_14_3_um_filter_34_10]|nr:MAG: hypothetical protein CO129_06930 [Ignavibacteriales bacterium CG_4_9_14_3_um_filter_34_10]
MKLKKKIFTKSNILLFSIPIIVLFYFILSKNDSIEQKTENKMKTFDSFEFKKEGELTFINTRNQFISKVDIEIADDNDSRATGLMFRKKLDINQGMLFIFDYEDYQSFWMKNTVLSLDMIFVNKNNEIIKIHKHTTPFSEQSYPSINPSIYVIEVNAGYTDQFSIKEGDKVNWRKV